MGLQRCGSWSGAVRTSSGGGIALCAKFIAAWCSRRPACGPQAAADCPIIRRLQEQRLLPSALQLPASNETVLLVCVWQTALSHLAPSRSPR